FGEERQGGSGPAGAGKLGARVANRFLSLARSFGRYIFTTRPGGKRAADAPQDATPSAINGPVSGPGVPPPHESRQYTQPFREKNTVSPCMPLRAERAEGVSSPPALSTILARVSRCARPSPERPCGQDQRQGAIWQKVTSGGCLRER